MKIIHRYIAKSFFAVFAVALAVLCFVLSIGFVVKAAAMISAGASIGLVLRFLWAGFPFILSLAIPVAALAATILLFGRLSADSEISAMRACGFPLRSIMAMPLLLGLLLSALCFYLHGELVSEGLFVRNAIRANAKAPDILALARPGQYVNDIPNLSLFVGDRRGQELFDVRIVETLKNGTTRDIRAERARITNDDDSVQLELFAVTMDPVVATRPGAAYADRYVHRVPREQPAATVDIANRPVKERYSLEMIRFVAEHWRRPGLDKETRVQIAKMCAELSKRMVLSLACFCFILIGIPLNIASHRQESSVRSVVCLAVAGLFYVFIILAESLAKGIWSDAWTLAWIPVALCLLLGATLVHRNP
ncbi:MAG: LptF/LptG family permease [Kiritimatiellaeota bacterium]|nr:LptF/LptG family permease [Kiritimatiellota bacterium]